MNDPLWIDKDRITTRHVYLNKIFEHYWKRWQREYLLALRERYNFVSDQPKKVPKIGQVVLIHDETPRIKWKLGIVVKLIRGDDNYIRSVSLKTNTGICMRPVTKLYPLEIEANEDYGVKTILESNLRNLPKRNAAIKAVENIRLCM